MKATCPEHPTGRMAPMANDASWKRCIPSLKKVIVEHAHEASGQEPRTKTVQPKCKFTRSDR